MVVKSFKEKKIAKEQKNYKKDYNFRLIQNEQRNPEAIKAFKRKPYGGI